MSAGGPAFDRNAPGGTGGIGQPGQDAADEQRRAHAQAIQKTPCTAGTEVLANELEEVVAAPAAEVEARPQQGCEARDEDRAHLVVVTGQTAEWRQRERQRGAEQDRLRQRSLSRPRRGTQQRHAEQNGADEGQEVGEQIGGIVAAGVEAAQSPGVFGADVDEGKDPLQ